MGDPHAVGVVELYVDPICPFNGLMVREQGDEMGQRIANGTLRINLRFVDFLDKYSASKTYDVRALLPSGNRPHRNCRAISAGLLA